MLDTEGSSILFDDIINDVKNALPLFEEVIMKGTKFYAAIKQTAITGDGFLDSLQKLADATTNSKGATKDIGVSFTKIVMRHKAIETKLKTYVGILADNFLTPFQENLDEWKKNTSQLEKDHTKDYKRLKGDLKKANSEVVKLRKKATKKFGRQHYGEQYRDAIRISTSLSKTLEDQEKIYLRKIMVEERARACQFFSFIQPCIEQEMTLISEIEQLDSILEETKKKCNDPLQLPITSEELVQRYKVPELLILGNKDVASVGSHPTSPALVKDYSLLPKQMGEIQSRCSILRYGNDLDPIPVNIQSPIWPSVCVDNLSGSSHSSSSSLHDKSGEFQSTQNSLAANDLQINVLDSHDPHYNHSSIDCKDKIYHQNLVNMQHAIKVKTSCSSAETSDSSGIGSYHSLNSNHRRSNSTNQIVSHYRGGIDGDVIETDYLNENGTNIFPPPPSMKTLNYPHIVSRGHSNGNMKYATIDRSHFKKKQFYVGDPTQEFYTIKQRSNSLGENPEEYPLFPHYKMNLPKSKVNTIAGTRYQESNNTRANIYNLFGGQSPTKVIKKLVPDVSPCTKMPPASPESRRCSMPCRPYLDQKPPDYRDRIRSATLSRVHTIDNDPDPARPGSFEAELQAQRRKFIERRNHSVKNHP